MSQPKVFVSHSHIDDAFAGQLVKDLISAGVDAWLDSSDLGAGDFVEHINVALDQCEWFILVLTRAALESQWVRQEVHAANRLKHQERIHDLIFIQAGEVEQYEIPAMWGVYNVFDATTDYAAVLQRLGEVIGLHRVEAPLPPGDAPLAQIQQPLLGSVPGAICPSCGTFNPLDDTKMIIRMSQASLFDPYVHARCRKCAFGFNFIPPNTHQ